jgi:hypothetical protein
MAFSPPNDFVVVEPGRSWGKIAVGVGGGCLVVVALVALLLTYGTCKTTEGCCDSIEATGRRLTAPAQAFVDRVGAGDVDGAYDAMSPEYRQRTSRAELAKFIADSGGLFKGGEVKFVRVGHRKIGEPRYVVSVQIVDSATRTQKGLATFVYRETDADTFVIDGVLVGDGATEFARGDVELMLRDHAALLWRRDFTGAYRLHDAGYATSDDVGAYRDYIESEGSAFFEGSFEVAEVEVDGDGARARARGLLTAPTDGAKPTVVEYELARERRGGWWIKNMKIVVETEIHTPGGGGWGQGAK